MAYENALFQERVVRVERPSAQTRPRLLIQSVWSAWESLSKEVIVSQKPLD